MSRIRSSLIVLVSAVFASFAATAQDRPNTILVLDGSGSMWGQIDGIAKITIAQQVVGELLGTIPADQALGLTVYGHRRKGDCSDIETVVVPGAGSRAAISEAVNAISPKGKTPMTDAVRAAAEALRYQEERATVILVSDGIETCNPDPCAAARVLEETGVDFTAHVVGFDVTDVEALRQMQCLAAETGGIFLTASNASELTTAMTAVAAAAPEPVPDPEPEPVTIGFLARDGEFGPSIDDGLVWWLYRGDTVLVDARQAGRFSEELPPGEYRVEVLRPADEAAGEAIFGVGEVDKTVMVVLPEYRPLATVEAPATGVAGATVQVRWTGPNAKNDYIAVGDPGERGDLAYTYTREGPLLDLVLPPKPGTYEVRYTLSDGRKVLATQPITVTPVTATLATEGPLPAGGLTTVVWEGPNYRNDYIALTKPGETVQLTYTYTREGSPLDLQMPAEAGAYELQYVMANKRTVIASLPVTVTEVTASVAAPDDLTVGAKAKIAWTGPNNRNDYIAVFPKGGDRYVSYAYTRDGDPVTLTLPGEAGDYVLAYVMNQGHRILASAPITVAEVAAMVTPPQDLPAGGSVKIAWTGPDNQNDYVAIFAAGADRYLTYAYTRNGSPATLALPAEPGAYEVRYVLNAGHRALVSVPIEITPVSASLTPPAALPMGATVKVDWQGPGNRGDFIAIFPEGKDRYVTYAYTRNGNPAEINLPPEPGAYQLAYVLDQDNKVLASVPVTVTPVTASVTAPDALPAGGTVPVGWTGPGYDRDYIAITPRGGDRYVAYAYTRNGNPTKLTLPATPGDYVLSYKMNAGDTELASVAISVSPVSATLTVPGELSAGSTVSVDWDGPDNARDYIAVVERGSNKLVTYTQTARGHPAKLKLPDAPGDYDIAYVLNVDTTVIARVPVTID